MRLPFRSMPKIEPLYSPPRRQDLLSLAGLLVDAVDSGAAVSFLSPLPIDDALEWWTRLFASANPRGVIFVARDEQGELIGTVQVVPAWAPNQPHRAEIAKLIVHRRARRQGLGRALMFAAEDAARSSGFRLLTLDAKRGTDAERLYRSLGWSHAGTIPGFALDPDGQRPHDAVLFYKPLIPG